MAISKSLLHILLLFPSIALAHFARFQTSSDRTSTPDSTPDGAAVFSLTNFKAAGDGSTDDSTAFAAAWTAACNNKSDRAVVYVPKGKDFLLHPISLKGPCQGSVSVQVEGNLLAPKDPKSWNQDDNFWMQFRNMKNFVINGNGVINGQGDNWWSCVQNNGGNCPSKSPPSTLVSISDSSDVTVKNLHFMRSQKMHITFDNCVGVTATNIRITSPESSPNTDGIHLERSSNVVIQNCNIGTGDDCISISSGTSHVTIKDVNCGPGHGISIGSLGRDHAEAQVQNIVVDGATLSSTMNGVRIKTWQGGSGFARSIQFQNVKMDQVKNPIIIDQYYCTGANQPCGNETSAVEVSGISYKDISGTSQTTNAIIFHCSESVPCHNIVLENIDITHSSSKNVQAVCENANGQATGNVQPPSCLSS